MGLGVFFREDLERILMALASAGGAAYGPAYVKALGDVATAIGARLPIGGWGELVIAGELVTRGEVWDVATTD